MMLYLWIRRLYSESRYCVTPGRLLGHSLVGRPLQSMWLHASSSIEKNCPWIIWLHTMQNDNQENIELESYNSISMFLWLHKTLTMCSCGVRGFQNSWWGDSSYSSMVFVFKPWFKTVYNCPERYSNNSKCILGSF